jgi:hypothetical protein
MLIIRAYVASCVHPCTYYQITHIYTTWVIISRKDSRRKERKREARKGTTHYINE